MTSAASADGAARRRIPAPPPDVAAVFGRWPAPARKRLRELRKLILETAAGTEGVGTITETLKWGEPAYLTEASKSGTTIRIGWTDKSPQQYAMYVHCQTTLVDEYRAHFPELTCEGNRAVVFALDAPLPKAAVSTCIEMALTYHRRRRG